MIVCAARANSLIGSKHHPGEKKVLDTNNCFPAFLGLTFVLSKSLGNHSRCSEGSSAAEKEFKIQTLNFFLLTDLRPTHTLVPMLNMLEGAQATFEIFFQTAICDNIISPQGSST